jgi:hypothetical protein
MCWPSRLTVLDVVDVIPTPAMLSLASLARWDSESSAFVTCRRRSAGCHTRFFPVAPSVNSAGIRCGGRKCGRSVASPRASSVDLTPPVPQSNKRIASVLLKRVLHLH